MSVIREFVRGGDNNTLFSFVFTISSRCYLRQMATTENIIVIKEYMTKLPYCFFLIMCYNKNGKMKSRLGQLFGGFLWMNKRN